MRMFECVAWVKSKQGKASARLSAGLFLFCVVALTLPSAYASQVGVKGETGLRLYTGAGQSLGYAPQLDTDVAIKVSGMLARVRVQQRFHNPSDAWVEGIYVFPLPENAAVDRLRMLYAERLIEGEIQERQQAERNYAAAKTKGQGASLVKQQRANVFTTAVANIPPGDSVQVEIEYQQPLLWRDGEIALRFPMVVAPRYIPGKPLATESGGFSIHGWATDTDQVPDASQITPPVAFEPPDDLNPIRIRVELNTGVELDMVESSFHPIDVEKVEPGHHLVKLKADKVRADRDFELRWRPKLSQQPSAALFKETWKGEHYALLMLMPPQPDLAPEPVARELILVVDTSGSMHGDSMEQARAALLQGLGRLRPNDRFNIIQFNSGFDVLFERAQAADPAHLRQARRYVNGLQADGGTEMLPALRYALDDPKPSGLLRQVVFLTDGAVGNEQALFETITRHLGGSRLFTIGIGSAPNALFMTGAARFGRGSFTYIGAISEVEAKVGKLFKQLDSPLLTDVRLRWETDNGVLEVSQTPEPLPDLYAGEPLVVAISAAEVPQRVEIEGMLGDRPWRHSASLVGGAQGAGVHALWARHRIDDWMARGVIGESAERVREVVLELALEHHLVSRFTSLVAIDKTPSRPDDSLLRSGAVPTRLPAGWSATKVFGQLPNTATPAPLFTLFGVLSLLIAVWARRGGA